MTATITPAADLDGVVKRADARWAGRHGDEPAAPEYLKAITDAVRPLLEQTGAAGPGVDLDELARLRSESDARGRLLEDRATEIAELTTKLERARSVGTASVERLTRERDEARAERDTARAQLRDAAPAPDVERLTGEVAELTKQLAAATRDLALANKTLDEIADDAANQPTAVPHRHQYQLDLATGRHADCECGQPWIRDLVEEDEPVVPDVEPLDQLFARIRAEVGEATT